MIQNTYPFHQRKIFLITHGDYLGNGKLEYLENLVKLARKNCDEGLNLVNLTKVKGSHAMHKINVNKNHCSKLLHLEINNHLVEGLVGITTSMFANVVQKIGIIYLIIG